MITTTELVKLYPAWKKWTGFFVRFTFPPERKAYKTPKTSSTNVKGFMPKGKGNKIMYLPLDFIKENR